MTFTLPQELLGHVLVAGAGVSGAGCARMLVDLGVKVTVADDDETARLRVSEATGAQCTSVSNAHSRLSEFSAVVTSPGWRPVSPLLVDATAANLPVLGDVELCWRLDQAGVFGDPRTWLVVTGTNGKTTTTAMLTEMMKRGPKTAASVGNIGVAIGDALVSKQRIDVLVAELSSFQLHWSSTIRPAAGCLLNLADDHIDWHGSFFEYGAAKAKALLGDIAVVGIDDPEVRAQVDHLHSQGELDNTRVIGFTLVEPAEGEVGIVDGNIVDRAFDGGVIAPATGISPAGPAGQLDALAATAVARSQGIPAEAIAEALSSYEVSGHRGQVVHEVNGIQFIDNSKATNPHAADAALTGHDSIVWVAGGQLKGADITELISKHAPRIKAALVLGVDRHLIADELHKVSPQTPVVLTDSTDPAQAMSELVGQAVRIAVPGDVVILAPAAASLDMYSGMGQRGDIFAQAARTLAPIDNQSTESQQGE